MSNKLCNILIFPVIIAAISVVFILGLPLILGRQLYAVQTGSMEPTYPIGTILVVEPIHPEVINVGDVITFSLTGFDTVVTHRVISIDQQGQQLFTQGDSNDQADFAPVKFPQIKGRVSYGIPYLGHLTAGLRTIEGQLILLWLLLLTVLLLFLPDMVNKLRKRPPQNNTKEGNSDEAAI